MKLQKTTWLLALVSAACLSNGSVRGAEPVLDPQPGSKIVLIGNALAERMQHFNHWETLLHHRFPDRKLVVRNLGWSADSITTRLRSLDFQDHGHTLLHHQPDIILAFFGFNESFDGPEGIDAFKTNLVTFLTDLRQMKYPHQNYRRGSDQPEIGDGPGQATHTPQIVLISPIANEDLPDRGLSFGTRNNENLRLYTAAMQEVAEANRVPFVDLWTPTLEQMADDGQPWTINGCHLNAHGDAQVGRVLDAALFGSSPSDSEEAQLGPLQAAIEEKNRQHWFDFRAVNGYYIYGDRKKPFGVVNFPPEFAKLRNMVAVRDERVWNVAQGREVPKTIDDSHTGDFVKVETNFKDEVHITSPEEALQRFTVKDGFEVQLVASEVDFPDLKNPVQMTFDARGRIWVTTMPNYPMYLPGTPVDDKVLILEDTDHDGRMDRQTVFADGLHVPTGIELGDGGAYVATQPNLTFFRDVDGDDKADESRIILHGFDSADSHHSISAFEWGPDGGLYFQEGTFHHSQVESPYGPQRLVNAGIFRYEPRTEKLSVFVSYGYANPWGHVFDRWGQDFVADASGGANHFAAAYSGDVDFPRKHAAMKEFLVKQWRPTAGCELVSSRNFPDDMQGDYLLNNCIGFQGVLQYHFRDEGSGFAADPVEPLLRSSDLNFRPVDLQFGPDGALYLVDWFNPLVGHMQHSIRDPKRDYTHGRIWRVVYKNKPLVDPPLIAGQSLNTLLDLLKSPEDRTRYRVRRELRSFPTADVITAVDAWVANLKPSDEQTPHLQLEALWVKQNHDVVDPELLKTLLRSEDYRARAAATRVLSYWLDRVDEPLKLLSEQINDEHPRVRLEAVRALSFFRGADVQPALDLAAEVFLADMDDYLEYTYNETRATLDGRLNSTAIQASK